MLYLQENAELSRMTGVEPGSMAQLLKRMTREGLIKRRRYPRDVVRVAQPVMPRLTLDLGLSSHLAVLEGHEII